MRSADEIYIAPGRRSLREQAAELLRFRELLFFLVWKILKVRYAQALLGALWAILQPLLTALLLALMLSRFARIPTDGIPPFAFYLTALVPWTFFANALTASAASLVANQPLIMKVYFPRICLPISGVLSAIVDLMVPLMLLLVVIGYSRHSALTLEAVFAIPFLLVIAAITAAGLGIGLAALNLRYRDVSHVLPFFIQILFFVSPTIYSVSRLPSAWRTFYFLNPMAAVIDGFRALLLGTHPLSWTDTVTSLCSALVLLCIGVVYFERDEYRFADVA